jgi:hypothetical protein
VRWLECAIELHARGAERADAFFALAQLYEGPLNSRRQAEAALRETLALDPSHSQAEGLLVAIFRDEARLAELADHYEQAARRAGDPERRVALWRAAADVHLSIGGNEGAALALLAARSAAPADLSLTAEAAELLHQLGRSAEAAELDALLLAADPMQPRVFQRHVRFLSQSKDHRALAQLMVRRAEREAGAASASSYLEAARSHRASGAEDQARVCEERAFALAPEDERAFEAMMGRAQPDARRMSELLLARARALPDRAAALLWQRARLLSESGEPLLAAEALDDFLAVEPEHWEALSARAELAAAGGGATAAQPFDRRLLAAGGPHLSAAARARICLRLGHASLASGALQDAADVLEQAVAFDGNGEPGRNALSLLSEIYAHTGNAPGLYRATMAMAESAQSAEAEALYRRAADLFDDPKHAIDALLKLVQLRSLDVGITRRAVDGLKSLRRYADVLDLCERTADSIGGPVGAEMLLEGAEIAEGELGDPRRATELRDRAYLLDPMIALENRFEPLMAAGQSETALALADGAGDAERAREALWAIVHAEGWSARAERLAGELRQLGDFRRLLDLARVLERSGSSAQAAELLEEVTFGKADAALRTHALARLFATGAEPRILDLAIGRIDEGTSAEWIEAVLQRARAVGGDVLASALNRAASALPSKATDLLRELFELEQRQGHFASAADALRKLLLEEEDLPARAALHVELGALLLGPLAEPVEAREAFELALAEDLESVPAVQRLLELYDGERDAERFVAMVERLSRLLGATAVEPYRESLARAYETLGRKLDALHLLSLLEETPERLRHRAQLAHELGLEGESLQLRERVAETREDQQSVLMGYLQAGLVPAAVLLANRMLERGFISAAIKKTLAQRLAGSDEGARLAASLWPDLLREDVANPEGWKAFAEALRRARRTEAAELAHGFFLGLSGAPATSPLPRIAPLEGTPMQTEVEPPYGCLPITGEAMPRLHRSLSLALTFLSSGVEQLYLDPAGGAEAFLLREGELLLGAAALSCFGPAELAYLCALALALGDHGHALARRGPVEGLEEAAALAFDSVPSSLAASRVLTVLDEHVRGSDPSRMNAQEVLSRSGAFRSVAMRALALM